MEDARAQLRKLASGQDGQFATAQALGLGLTPEAIRWLRRRGETLPLRRHIWRFASAGGDPDPAVTAWLLCWPVGVVSHGSAAPRHGVRRVPEPALPVVTVPHHCRHRPTDVDVRRSRQLEAVDRITIDGVTYTTMARTVCDLTTRDDTWESLAILDDAVARGTKPGWINKRAHALLPGRPELALITKVTGRGAAGAFRSWLERAAGHVYRLGHLPDPTWNVPVYDEAGRIGVVDALWEAWRVVAEKEGLRFHTTPAQRRRDAERFNRLLDARYDTRRFTWEDVVHRPVWVVATVTKALRAAGADLDPARIPRRIDLPAIPFL